MVGQNASDKINGGKGSDLIWGGAGDDFITGGVADDGDTGRDSIDGVPATTPSSSSMADRLPAVQETTPSPVPG